MPITIQFKPNQNIVTITIIYHMFILLGGSNMVQSINHDYIKITLIIFLPFLFINKNIDIFDSNTKLKDIYKEIHSQIKLQYYEYDLLTFTFY